MLSLFEERGQGAPDGEAGAVEGDDRLGLAGMPAGADVGSAGLERAEVRDRGDLAVRVLTRDPDLDVVRELGGEAGVTGGQLDDPLREPQLLQARFGMADHRLRLGFRGLRVNDPDNLDHVELVLADQATRVPPVRASLGTETRGMRGEGKRHAFPNQDRRRVRIELAVWVIAP